MYKAVLFDFDLTLVDSAKPIVECYQYTLEKFGYDVPDYKTVFDLIGLPLTDTIDILTTGGEPNPQRKEMQRVYVEKADEIMSDGSRFYSGVPQMLEQLHDRGIKTAVVSTKLAFRIAETFERQLGRTAVDLIIGLDDISQPKPSPQGILLAAERLGVGKGSVLYVGDNVVDAKAAQNAGVDFAAVLTGSTPREVFEGFDCRGIFNSAAEIDILI